TRAAETSNSVSPAPVDPGLVVMIAAARRLVARPVPGSPRARRIRGGPHARGRGLIEGARCRAWSRPSRCLPFCAECPTTSQAEEIGRLTEARRRPPEREERPEGRSVLPPLAPGEEERGGDRAARHHRDEEREQTEAPPEERAQHGAQLHIAHAHAAWQLGV